MSDQTFPLVIKQYARYIPADMDTPISLFMSLASRHNAVLLESTEVDGRWGRYSVMALDMAFTVHCRKACMFMEIHNEQFRPLEYLNGRPFIEALRELMQNIEILAPDNMKDLTAITRALYGYFGFGMAALFNKKLIQENPLEVKRDNSADNSTGNSTGNSAKASNKMTIDEADCSLALPNTLLLFDHVYNRLSHISLDSTLNFSNVTQQGLNNQKEKNSENSPISTNPSFMHEKISLDAICSTPEKEEHIKRILQIKEMLRQGEAIQAVLSVRFSVPFQGDSFSLYRKMRRYNASPYMFYMNFPHISLFGASPEVMVRCTKGKLQLSPIAGTRKRGANDDEDSNLARELLADPKEQAEHVMLVDLGRNDLGKIATPGTVQVERYMEVERFSHVMHLTSRINADLAPQYDALDILASTFPAGTVSGAPKIRAMEMIRELEGQARGPYAGCIGWLGLDKDSVNMDMGITIRSMWHENNTLFWQAGGGIVYDSNPELEWDEVMNKSAIMRLILQDEVI